MGGRTAYWTLVLTLAAAGCGQVEPARPAAHAAEPAAVPPVLEPAVDQAFLSNECPPATASADREIAAQSAAIVPLKPGLTLSTTWHRATQGDEVECLTHVTGVGTRAVGVTANCSMSTGTQGGSRRTCRADLQTAYMYYTGAGDEPDVLRGTTMFSLSTAAFKELKSTGNTRHRFVSVLDGAIVGDMDGALRHDGTATYAVIVNDRVVELPVVRASGALRGTAMGKPIETSVGAAIVDDDRFPLVLDYALPNVGATGFSVRYSKVSFPTDGAIEKQLADTERIDVYGIYFDVGSDRLRGESAPVLQEIAAALARHPDWQLTIDGHTDSVGGTQANLDLSRRRSEAVRAVLVERHGVAASRLSALGHGDTVPKATNDTAEGRARNRRVELVRQ